MKMGRMLRILPKGFFLILIAGGALSGCSNEAAQKSTAPSTYSSKQVFDSDRQVYRLEYSVTLPSSASLIDFIELREIDGDVDATLTCETGVPVKTWNGPFESGEVIRGDYLAGSESKFKYLFCFRDTAGVTSKYSETAQ